MSYIYLGAAVQLLLILSALRVTAVQALQATQSKHVRRAPARARAARLDGARQLRGPRERAVVAF